MCCEQNYVTCLRKSTHFPLTSFSCHTPVDISSHLFLCFALIFHMEVHNFFHNDDTTSLKKTPKSLGAG